MKAIIILGLAASMALAACAPQTRAQPSAPAPTRAVSTAVPAPTKQPFVRPPPCDLPNGQVVPIVPLGKTCEGMRQEMIYQQQEEIKGKLNQQCWDMRTGAAVYGKPVERSEPGGQPSRYGEFMGYCR